MADSFLMEHVWNTNLLFNYITYLAYTTFIFSIEDKFRINVIVETEIVIYNLRIDRLLDRKSVV